MTTRKQMDDWVRGGTTKINNRLLFGQGNPNEPATVVDYSVTFAELLGRIDPAGQQAKAVRQG